MILELDMEQTRAGWRIYKDDNASEMNIQREKVLRARERRKTGYGRTTRYEGNGDGFS